LSPPVLYDFGFKEALETLAQATESRYGLHVAAKFAGDMDQIDEEIKIILYRNIKELIHNAVRHAKANRITISVDNSQHRLSVNVKDSGVGWDVEHFTIGSTLPDGFGLFDIREKMSHLGGELKIDSAPGRGTSIYMEVPLKNYLN
jgi:signal transduction histidine kinase